MPILPDSKLAQIEFFEAHIAVWTANAAAIGITVPNVTVLSSNTIAARTAYNAAQVARQASKAATTTFNNAHAPMRDLGGDLIAMIKAFAETTNNPAVYAVAQIPPPAPPQPAPPPAQPTDLAATLDTFGVLTLTWKSVPKGPTSGIFFFVERKVGTGAWTPLGGTQDASFIDPVGLTVTNVIQYRVKARRGDESSAWSDQLAVDFTGGQDSIAGFVGGDEVAEAA